MPDLEVYIPLSEYLPSSLWPSDLFATGGDDFLDNIAYDDGIISSDDNALYANVALRVITEMAFQFPAGFAFVLGKGSVNASVYKDAAGYTAQIFPQTWKLRLPQSLFTPTIQADGKFSPDPDLTHFVDINLPVGLNTDSEGTLDLAWSEEEVEAFQLPPCLLGESGIVVAANFILRLSENQPLPEGAAELGLETDWRGLFISNITLQSASGSGELVLPLLGSSEVSLVLDPASIQAIVTFGEDATSFGITTAVKVRFQPSLLQPMRKVESADGRTQFEPDLTRPHTDIALDRVGIVVNTVGKVALVGSLPPIHLDDSVKLSGTDVVIESADLFLDFSGDRKLLAFRWRETNLGKLLRGLAPNFGQQGVTAENEITLRVIFGDPIEEIRLDWQSDREQTFALPGIKAIAPKNSRFSVLLSPVDASQTPNQLKFVVTLPASSTLTASSNFAWEREEERELHNDDTQPGVELFGFQATCSNKEVSLVLLSFRIDEFKLPKFFQQLESPIAALDFSNIDSLSQSSHLSNTGSLAAADWNDVAFSLNLDHLDQFELPFLKQKGDENDQLIQVLNPNAPDPFLIKAVPDSTGTHFNALEIPLGVKVTIGTLEFITDIKVNFNWETFALLVDHKVGIEMVSAKPQLPERDVEFLGLKWRFKGALVEAGHNQGKYHYFTLATKDYNYQIQQAEGATFEVDFTRASDEPITFAIRNFALTPKGVNLTAEVTDRPAKLSGIDTRFRFHGSRFEIKENRIADFTLAGSGPLPPALVGDATADIALQFAQRNGALDLIAGHAQLKASKTLYCQDIRFRFDIDALGLQFVNDGKYHLYFTLTGRAQFVLLPGDKDGPLSLLSLIKIDLVECPLTGDARVISQHVKFLIEMPRKKSFNVFGCFEMELRAIGFVPQAEFFGGDGAIQLLTWQLLSMHQQMPKTPYLLDKSAFRLHSLLLPG